MSTTTVQGNVDRRRLVLVSVAAGIWALWYALYRGYYAAGGTAYLPGVIRPGSEGTFQAINLAAAVIIGVAAVVPLAALRLWSLRWPRRALLTLCWVVAVGCCMHASVNIVERVLSLSGVLHVDYPPLWASVDDRTADLQDLFFNEPWFLAEGLAFGALAALTLLGTLTATGVLDKTIVW